MAAKYTTTASSTLPQLPAMAELTARIMAGDKSIDRPNAIAFAGTIFDAVAAVPYTGNNLLSICSIVVRLMQADPELSLTNAIAEAGSIWTDVAGVQQ